MGVAVDQAIVLPQWFRHVRDVICVGRTRPFRLGAWNGWTWIGGTDWWDGLPSYESRVRLDGRVRIPFFASMDLSSSMNSLMS